jgi:mRNA interferase MazF
MQIRRGDVVLIEFRYSDLLGSKLRPALVVQDDFGNRRLIHTIVAQITSRIHPPISTRLVIDISAADGGLSGLRHVSMVSCENLTTVEKDLIVRKLGLLPDVLMRKIDQCLKSALGIP